MKKAILVAPYWPSFRDDFTRELHAKLAKSGVSLCIVAGTARTSKVVKNSESGLDHLLQYETIKIGLGRVSLQWQKDLVKSIRSLKPDVVVIHPRVAILNYYFLSWYLGVIGTPKIFWDGGFERLDLGFFTTQIKRRLKKLQEFGALAYLTYSKRFAASRESGTRVEVFSATNTVFVEKIVKQTNLATPDSSGLRLVYFGAITKDKRLEKALDALKILVDQNHSIQLSIIGSGKHVDALRKYVEKLDLSAHVSFDGPKYRDELWSFLSERNCDLFCLPGIGGLAVNEALACGVPVISTVGDGTIGDLIDEGKNGWLLEFDSSSEEISKRCSEYMSLSLEEKSQMRENCQSIIMNRAPLAGMVDGFFDAIHFGLRSKR